MHWCMHDELMRQWRQGVTRNGKVAALAGLVWRDIRILG